jgi:hypothetical protein
MYDEMMAALLRIVLRPPHESTAIDDGSGRCSNVSIRVPTGTMM